MARVGGSLSQVLVITALAGGCGDASSPPAPPPGPAPTDASPSEPLPGFASGSRYQARFLAGPGLEPLLLSVHDRQADRDCLPARDPAGVVRCGGLEMNTALEPVGPPIEGVPSTVALTSRLSTRGWSTPDGGRFPLVRSGSFELLDDRWDAPCAPVQLGGMQPLVGTQTPSALVVLCMPPFAGHSYLFEDVNCRVPLVQAHQAEPALLAIHETTPRALGEPWTGPVHLGYGSTCGPTTMEQGPLRRLGPPLAEDALVRLHRVPRGDRRLALLAFESQGQLLGPARDARKRLATAYFDAELNLECTPLRTPAGVRCLARVAFLDERELRYRDSACTQPALTTLETAVVVLAPSEGHPLARALSLHALGDWFGGAVVDVYRKEGGACLLRPEKNTFRPLTGTLPWDRYAPLEEWLGPHRL